MAKIAVISKEHNSTNEPFATDIQKTSSIYRIASALMPSTTAPKLASMARVLTEPCKESKISAA